MSQLCSKCFKKFKHAFEFIKLYHNPFDSQKTKQEWQDSRRPMLIFFIIYSFVLHNLRQGITGQDMGWKVAKMEAEERTEQEIEEIKDRFFEYRVLMLCTGALTFLTLIGILCRYRAVYYLIPWVLLIDKVFEYPISYELLTPHTNMILAIYSQSALFQIVLFSCNNFVESACIFWVLQIRISTYIYTVNDEEIP